MGHKADLIAYDPAKDLALIKIEWQLRYGRISIADSKLLSSGREIGFFGSPNMLYSGVSYGKITSLDTVNQINYISSDMNLAAGSKGGAFINMYGEMIGICCVVDLETGQNKAVTSNDVKGFLDSIGTQAALKDYLAMQGQPY